MDDKKYEELQKWLAVNSQHPMYNRRNWDYLEERDRREKENGKKKGIKHPLFNKDDLRPYENLQEANLNPPDYRPVLSPKKKKPWWKFWQRAS